MTISERNLEELMALADREEYRPSSEQKTAATAKKRRKKRDATGKEASVRESGRLMHGRMVSQKKADKQIDILID